MRIDFCKAQFGRKNLDIDYWVSLLFFRACKISPVRCTQFSRVTRIGSSLENDRLIRREVSEWMPLIGACKPGGGEGPTDSSREGTKKGKTDVSPRILPSPKFQTPQEPQIILFCQKVAWVPHKHNIHATYTMEYWCNWLSTYILGRCMTDKGGWQQMSKMILIRVCNVQRKVYCPQKNSIWLKFNFQEASREVPTSTKPVKLASTW